MTPEEIADEVLLHKPDLTYLKIKEHIADAIREAIQAEREACAKTLDAERAEIEATASWEAYKFGSYIPYLRHLAKKIRARSEGEEG